ncbi:PREDICTED: keratin, type II cytoskeletal 1-like, partial [Priapulus caudatus]|uniref:Keratin, type II cytoskeletal 1-like n=1 Tax=Priapulus caudatus TaxID=37621 RepID=A0ABM1F3A1_PRICU
GGGDGVRGFSSALHRRRGRSGRRRRGGRTVVPQRSGDQEEFGGRKRSNAGGFGMSWWAVIAVSGGMVNIRRWSFGETAILSRCSSSRHLAGAGFGGQIKMKFTIAVLLVGLVSVRAHDSGQKHTHTEGSYRSSSGNGNGNYHSRGEGEVGGGSYQSGGGQIGGGQIGGGSFQVGGRSLGGGSLGGGSFQVGGGSLGGGSLGGGSFQVGGGSLGGGSFQVGGGSVGGGSFGGGSVGRGQQQVTGGPEFFTTTRYGPIASGGLRGSGDRSSSLTFSRTGTATGSLFSRDTTDATETAKKTRGYEYKYREGHEYTQPKTLYNYDIEEPVWGFADVDVVYRGEGGGAGGAIGGGSIGGGSSGGGAIGGGSIGGGSSGGGAIGGGSIGDGQQVVSGDRTSGGHGGHSYREGHEYTQPRTLYNYDIEEPVWGFADSDVVYRREGWRGR